MEKATLVRDGIYSLIAGYFGEPTAKNFLDYHDTETLPIFTHEALNVLSDFIGRDKAKSELQDIYTKNNMTHAYV
ncbi:MAG TPA: hypothetical protein VFG51_02075 [Candidatus Saccharimonadia bacterium]|nr:hypothetical protein [Candidatus Saccharimonadia bacterium]